MPFVKKEGMGLETIKIMIMNFLLKNYGKLSWCFVEGCQVSFPSTSLPVIFKILQDSFK